MSNEFKAIICNAMQVDIVGLLNGLCSIQYRSDLPGQIRESDHGHLLVVHFSAHHWW